jgi:DNA ligase (NAD+)
VATLLTAHFENLDALIDCSPDDLTALEGIGPVVAESIYNFFRQEENLDTIDRLRLSGVQILFETHKKYDRLKDKVFVLTGTLEGMTRRKAKEMIEAAGGKVSTSVSRNTDYVVAGALAGSKLDRAKELSIQIIDETALKALLTF